MGKGAQYQADTAIAVPVAYNKMMMTPPRSVLVNEDAMKPSERAALAEQRLYETQHVLVQERLQREVTEAMLTETSKALSAVRALALERGGVAKLAPATPLLEGTSEEHAREVLAHRLREVNDHYATLQTKHEERVAEVNVLRRKLHEQRDANTQDRTASLGGVTMKFEALQHREFTHEESLELVEHTRLVLEQAHAQAKAVEAFREVDEARVRALGDIMSMMEMRQHDLKEKLKEVGLLDEEYDDRRVASKAHAARRRTDGSLEPEADDEASKVYVYDGPVTSPLGKNFYVSRTVSFWDTWFGKWA